MYYYFKSYCLNQVIKYYDNCITVFKNKLSKNKKSYFIYFLK